MIDSMRVLLISSNTERLNMITIPLGLGVVAAANSAVDWCRCRRKMSIPIRSFQPGF